MATFVGKRADGMELWRNDTTGNVVPFPPGIMPHIPSEPDGSAAPVAQPVAQPTNPNASWLDRGLSALPDLSPENGMRVSEAMQGVQDAEGRVLGGQPTTTEPQSPVLPVGPANPAQTQITTTQTSGGQGPVKALLNAALGQEDADPANQMAAAENPNATGVGGALRSTARTLGLAQFDPAGTVRDIVNGVQDVTGNGQAPAAPGKVDPSLRIETRPPQNVAADVATPGKGGSGKAGGQGGAAPMSPYEKRAEGVSILEQEANQQKTEAQTAQGDALAANYDEQATRAQKDLADWQAKRGNLDAETTAALQRYKALAAEKINGTIDPNRWWASKSTGDKISTIIGFTLQAGFNGFAGQAPHDRIREAIQDDTRIQQQNYENASKEHERQLAAAGNLYAWARQAGLDSDSAFQFANARKEEIAATKVKALILHTQNPIIRADGAELSAKLAGGALDRDMKVHSNILTMRGQELANEGHRLNNKLLSAQIDSALYKAAHPENVPLAKNEFLIGGQKMVARDEKDREHLEKSWAFSRKAETALTLMESALDGKFTSFGYSDAGGAYAAGLDMMISLQNQAEDINGTVGRQQRQLVEKAAKPGVLRPDSSVRSALETFRKGTRQSIAEEFSTAGQPDPYAVLETQKRTDANTAAAHGFK